MIKITFINTWKQSIKNYPTNNLFVFTILFNVTLFLNIYKSKENRIIMLISYLIVLTLTFILFKLFWHIISLILGVLKQTIFKNRIFSECMGNNCAGNSSSPGNSTDDAYQTNKFNRTMTHTSYHDTTPNPIEAARLDRDVSTVLSSTALGAAGSTITNTPSSPIQGALAGGLAGTAKAANDRIQDEYNYKIDNLIKNEETKLDE